MTDILCQALYGTTRYFGSGPVLEPGGCQVKLPERIGHNCLALNDIATLRALRLRDPSPYVFAHDPAQVTLIIMALVQVFTHSLTTHLLPKADVITCPVAIRGPPAGCLGGPKHHDCASQLTKIFKHLSSPHDVAAARGIARRRPRTFRIFDDGFSERSLCPEAKWRRRSLPT